MENGVLRKYFLIRDIQTKCWINLQEFCRYMQVNYCSSDSKKPPRNDNMIRRFKSYSDTILTLENETFVSIRSVLRYIYENVACCQACSVIATDIEDSITGRPNVQTTVPPTTILDVYREVATGPLFMSPIFKHCLQQLQKEPKSETLYNIHKDLFKEDEWNKISLFEHHFAQENKESLDTIEGEIKSRKNFYRKCCLANETALQWKQDAMRVFVRRKKRFALASEEDGIEVYGDKQKHIPMSIDVELQEKIGVVYPEKVSTVICVDSLESRSKNGLHIYIETSVSELNSIEVDSIAQIVENTLFRNHAVQCVSIQFFKEGTFDDYMRGKHFARFICRDDIMCGKLSANLICNWTPTSLEFSHDPTIALESTSLLAKCKTCYKQHNIKPLSIESFDVMTEWLLDVPLIAQIILGTNINTKSMRTTKEIDVYMRGKLERLYTSYDVLLNISNRKFIGLHQQANTDDLIMHIKSANSVFALTSSSGTTMSIRAAEIKLKERAVDDACYFNTFLKEHPLHYITQLGSEANYVSLRACHIILMLDNLVRLKFKKDPDPGECRSQQICTLPITIQGVPKDSIDVSSWHNEAICDGTSTCDCKLTTNLTKTDFPQITMLSEMEADLLQRFQQMCTWGYTLLFQDIVEGEYSQYLESNETCDADVDEDAGSISSDDDVCIPVSHISEIIQQDHTDGSEEMEDEDELDKVIEEALRAGIDDDLAELQDIDTLMKSFNVLDMESISLPDDKADKNTKQDNLDDCVATVSCLEESFSNISLDNSINKTSVGKCDIPASFGFVKYCPPQLLCRHPPPATGRDDDIHKLREILDEVLVRLGQYDQHYTGQLDKVIVGADHKISSNLIKLLRSDSKYGVFMPEFPLLHMRKSKITSLFSAYKNTGLLHLLQYMRNDENQEWAKLVSAEHIEVATRNVKRLSIALHFSILLKFIQSLGTSDKENIMSDIVSEDPTVISVKWESLLQAFLARGSDRNATFCLHVDMMKHCDEIVALSFAERLGGKDGYGLLLAAVKSSLSFSFLNGATCYAPFCVHLMHQHYSAGFFHRHMKQCLFSTPINGSQINFATDTKREMDHQEVIRSFRSGSTTSSVVSRMSMIDHFQQLHAALGRNEEQQDKSDDLGWTISEVDKKHIYRAMDLIMRRGGLSTTFDCVPYNIYTSTKTILPLEILDVHCVPVGEYLVEQLACKEHLFGRSEGDMPNRSKVAGPKGLLNKLQRSKGITIRRSTAHTDSSVRTEKQRKEQHRKKGVAKETKHIECLSSDMNTCQSLVKPDCSKPQVQKSLGVQKAVIELFESHPEMLKDHIVLGTNELPKMITESLHVVAVEFAGMKFKTTAASGNQYLMQVESRLIRPLIQHSQQLERIIICEEKYSYTPDDFKGPTRQQRKQAVKSSISHLKTAKDMLSEHHLNKVAITTTEEGKMLISKYLALNVQKLSIKSDIILDIDSELHKEECSCSTEKCTCKSYCVPIRCFFTGACNTANVVKLKHIHQRKGEAELAVMDWLLDASGSMKNGENAASIITSGDIDAVVINLFCLPLMWPRSKDRCYKNRVYCVLQKPGGKSDAYNITGILEYLERKYSDVHIGVKVASLLCLGGNDFLPKYYGISHTKVLRLGLCDKFRDSLIQVTEDRVTLSKDVYKEFIKHLFCPKRMNPETATYVEIREATIQPHRQISSQTPEAVSVKTRNPQLWLPPETAVEQVASLVQLQLDYLMTVGNPAAFLPDFLASNCLIKLESGEVEYNFGPDSHISTVAELTNQHVPVNTMHVDIETRKRSQLETPQKGRRKKKQLTSTPHKC